MKKTYVFFGGYTDPAYLGGNVLPQGEGKGVYLYQLQGERLNFLHGVDAPNASYLTVNRKRTHVYAVQELQAYQGQSGGAVSAFRWNWEDHSLTWMNTQPVGGKDPCHVALDDTEKYLLCANYSSGSETVLPIGEDGGLESPCCYVVHQGRGMHPTRQTSPHTHGSFFAPGEKGLVFVPDLGMDRVVCYQLEKSTGKLHPRPELDILAPVPGSGPRHLLFHPSGEYLFLNTEMGSTVSVYRYDRDTGRTALLQTLSTLPAGGCPASTTAALKLHPQGRWLYVSNRGHDSLATYAFDPAKGRLTLTEIQPTGGHIPRDFAFSPEGDYAVVAHQASNNAVLFRVEKATGHLTKLEEVHIPAPVCVAFCTLP